MTDLRYALRGFRRAPAFTLTALLVIALGIGATTAVFSVVDRILFRSLPYPHGDRMVVAGIALPQVPGGEFIWGSGYLSWRDHHPGIEAITSWTAIGDCDLTESAPVRLRCARVESNFLSTIGIAPQIGRDFSLDDDRPDAPKQTLVSRGLWISRFAGNPNVVGTTISIDGQPVRIAGVLPASFEMPTLAHADLLLPQGFDRARFQRDESGVPIRVLARLAPGVTPQQAAGALRPGLDQTLAIIPPPMRKSIQLHITPLRDRQIRDVRLAAWVLLGAVLAVLLIACANVANLLLVRGAGRQREIAIRLALGAPRSRLIRQSLTESLVLGIGGGTAGILIAYWLLRAILAVAPDTIPRLHEVSIDSRALVFTLVFSILSATLFGLAPSLQLTNPATPRTRFLRQALVGAQIAISLVLLSAATLLARTLWNIESAPLGMQADNVMTASISIGPQRYPQRSRKLEFFEELEARIAKLPGVTVASISDSLPPMTPARSRPFAAIEAEGRAKPTNVMGPLVVWRSVTPGYFSALRIPILRGRAFEEADRDSGRHSIILSASLAGSLFPSGDALNRRVKIVDWFVVVGIAGDVANADPGHNDLEYYVSRSHASGDAIYSAPDALDRASVIVRSPLAPEAISKMIRAEVSAIDPLLPVTIESMPQRAAKLADRPRFHAALLAAFAGIGLLLAAVGLYGVVSFLVAQQTREIGVRMALGATSRGIAGLILKVAAKWTIAGAILGVGGSLAASRVLTSLLYGVSADDPLALAAPPAFLLLIAFAAAWLPARRAASIDPSEALRHE